MPEKETNKANKSETFAYIRLELKNAEQMKSSVIVPVYQFCSASGT